MSLSTLSEVQRLYVIDRFEQEARSTLAERINAAYAGSESSAAVVVGEVESAIDLSRMMQDLPAVEDLLEAANDAPIIRMLNALLTQAAKGRRQRHPHRALRARQLGPLPRGRHLARGRAAEPAACTRR